MPNREFPRAFLAHIRDHNRAVFGAICMSLFGAALVWPAVYLLVYTVGLIGLSIFVGPSTGYPPDFPLWFTGIALVSFPLCLGLNALMQNVGYSWLQQHQYLRWVLELMVAPHLLTLSVFGHLRAFCWLNHGELQDALYLLRRIDEARRMEVRRLEVEIPKPRRRQPLLAALSLMKLVTLLRSGDRLFVTLHDPSVHRLILAPVAIPSRREKRGRFSQKAP